MMRRTVFLFAVALVAPVCGLAADPVPGVDTNGDPLPPGAIARLGTLRLRRGLNSALTGDGKVLITASVEMGIRAWDAVSGKELRNFGWSPGDALRMALSPDGKALALAGGGRPVRVWDLEKRTEICRCEPELDRVDALYFASDGCGLFGAGGGAIHLWEVPSGKERARFDKQPDVRSMVLSTDGKELTVVEGATLCVLDAATGAERRRTSIGDGKTFTMAWLSPNGKVLVGAQTGRAILFWDGEGRPTHRGSVEPTNFLAAATFSPDSKWAATANGLEGMVRLWDTATGELVKELKGGG
jgi:WD40 repeat protein